MFMTCPLLQKGQGAPAREPLASEEEHKQMMLHYYKRQEELKARLLYDLFCFLLLEQCDLQLKKVLKFSVTFFFLNPLSNSGISDIKGVIFLI